MGRLGNIHRGFTLLETALTIIIVGIGVTAGMQLFASTSNQTSSASRMTVAMMLVSNVQERMAHLAFNDPFRGASNFGLEPGETIANPNDVDDFDGQTFSPPIDALGGAIADMAQYSQVVSVSPVYAMRPNSNNNPLNLEIPKTTYTGAVRVEVRVMFRLNASSPSIEVYRGSWVRVDG